MTTPPARRYTEEEARAVVMTAVESLRTLRAAVLDTVPAASRGRRDIVREIDAALAAVGVAVSGRIGDDQRSLWQRAIDAGKRAIDRTGRFLRDVRDATRAALARAWDVTLDVLDGIKTRVQEAVTAAWEATKVAVAAAAAVLAGLVAASGVVMFSGWVVLAAGIMIYLSWKGTK